MTSEDVEHGWALVFDRLGRFAGTLFERGQPVSTLALEFDPQDDTTWADILERLLESGKPVDALESWMKEDPEAPEEDRARVFVQLDCKGKADSEDKKAKTVMRHADGSISVGSGLATDTWRWFNKQFRFCMHRYTKLVRALACLFIRMIDGDAQDDGRFHLHFKDGLYYSVKNPMVFEDPRSSRKVGQKRARVAQPASQGGGKKRRVEQVSKVEQDAEKLRAGRSRSGRCFRKD